LRKTLVVLLAMLFLAAAAWAQTYTPNADPLLGPHNYKNNGCTSCHSPHGVTMEGSNGYLWALAIPAKSYTTYDNQSMNTTSLLTPDPLTGSNTPNNTAQIHTAMCLSCHDTAFSGMALSNPNNAVIDSSNTLLHNHPVDVQYPSPGTDPTFWVVNIVSGQAQFLDATDAVYPYGHPARLFVYNNAAYVECGSCHNPHAYQTTVVMQSGALVAVNTAHFVRGEYDTTAAQSNFCASCHADKAGPWDGQGDQ